MYVRERAGYDTITDPYAGTFGGLGGDDGEEFGGTAELVEGAVISLAMCAASRDPAGCIWNAIVALIEAQPDVQAILTTITAESCSAALTALGLSPDTVSLACLAGGSYWTAIQAKAQQKLEELGFPTAGPAPGARICPPHAEVTAVDASGRPTIYSIIVNSPPNADGSCPAGVPPVPGAPPPLPVPVPGTGQLQFQLEPSVACRGRGGTWDLTTRRCTMPALHTIPPGHITGRVVDESGAPVVGAEIRVGSLRNNVAGYTDATGAFSVSASATLVNWMYISASGYDVRQVDGAVASGTTRDAGAVTLKATPVEKSGTTARWYKNKWTYIIGGVVVVVGGVGIYAVRRRGR